MIVENEQKGNKQSFYDLEVCCRLIGEKTGKPEIASWTNRDYLRLSSLLSHDTDVQISASTLKRLFGKLKTPERYYPQKATRDALARFAGFHDWQNFVNNVPRPVPALPAKEDSEIVEKPLTIVPPKIKSSRQWYLAMGSAIISIAAICFWLLSTPTIPEQVLLDGVQLVCTNPEGENPHSASFRLDLPASFNGDAGKFSIHFGDSKNARPIFASQLLTHYYEVPGRYYATLRYDAKPLDTVSVYLKTAGWTATAFMEHDTTRVYPIDGDKLFKNRSLKVSTFDLLRSGVDTTHTFFVSFINAQPLDIDGDNFELKSSVFTSEPRPGVRCSQVILELSGEKANHSVMLIKPGCVSWAYLHFSDISKDGENDDLSALGADLKDGGNIALRIADKRVRLFIRDKLVYEAKYETPIGNIYAVKISFSGIGAVRYLQLRDLNSNKEFDDGFSNALAKRK